MPKQRGPSPAIATIASILLPGAGYLLLGQKLRALTAGGGILVLFFSGLLIAGVRVVDVPGYDEEGYRTYIEWYRSGSNVYARKLNTPAIGPSVRSGEDTAGRPMYEVARLQHDGTTKLERVTDPPVMGPRWVLMQAPLATIGENIAVIAHTLNGPLWMAGAYCSIQAARDDGPKAYSRLADVGSLYLVVSGMLNVMVIVDTAARSGRMGAES